MPSSADPAPGTGAPPPAAPRTHLEPRAVHWRNALTWFETAMRLVKRRPSMWALLAFVTLVAEFGLQATPGFGPALGKILVPLIACGMLYAAAAVDGGGVPRLFFSVVAFRAPGGAILAVVVASAITFGAEALAAWWIAEVNLLATDSNGPELTGAAITGIYAIGMLVSLPLTFVPFHALFENVPMGAAFAASVRGFVLNTVPLLVYGAVSLVLLGFGLITMGIGLVLVLPLWAASSYAAWKDIYAVSAAPAVR